MEKIVYIVTYIVGIIASLWSANNLTNLALLIFAFGRFRPSYALLPVLSLAYVILFIRAWMGKLSEVGKWLGVMVSIWGIYVMMSAPLNPVLVTHIRVLLFVVSGCLMLCDTKKDTKPFPGWGKKILVFVYVALFIILLAASLPAK